METKRFDNILLSDNDGVSRRAFIGVTLASSAAVLTGGLTTLVPRSLVAGTSAGTKDWIEATIPQLQALFNSGALTSQHLTLDYLNRITDRNPVLRALIEINPDAVAIAEERDRERRSGHLRLGRHRDGQGPAQDGRTLPAGNHGR